MVIDNTLHKLENLQQKSEIKDDDTCFILNTYSSLKYSRIPGLCKRSDNDETSDSIGFIAAEIAGHPIIYVEMLPNFVVGYTTRKIGGDFLVGVINKEIIIPIELAHNGATILGNVLFMEILTEESNG
jgi:hypothetical protein